MNTLKTGEILVLSLAIKMMVASLLSIAEGIKAYKIVNKNIKNGILVIVLMIICAVVGVIMNLHYESIFNLFFYTLGIDNIENYAKYTVNDIKENMNNKDKHAG